MGIFRSGKQQMVASDEALPGRSTPIPVSGLHEVLGHLLVPPFPEGMETAIFGLGCFWGAERKFWEVDGVHTTAVGYSGGYTPNPTYEEVCTARTGHAEAVLVVFDLAVTTYDQLVRVFWESHDPTQGMRQGNDMGTQYRSAIYTNSDAQLSAAKISRDRFQSALTAGGYGEITTEIAEAGTFYYAEDYHQQYLARNINGYCGLGGTGVQLSDPSDSCPTGLPLPDGAPSSQ
jgi:peptide-methionine (S)-S-oxide reductase